LLAIASISLMSFTSPEVLKENPINIELAETVELPAACCSAYQYFEGEVYEVVKVCGGSNLDDYNSNCAKAENIRDAILSAAGIN